VRSHEPSAGGRIFRVMTERQSSEVEKVLLFISDAQGALVVQASWSREMAPTPTSSRRFGRPTPS